MSTVVFFVPTDADWRNLTRIAVLASSGGIPIIFGFGIAAGQNYILRNAVPSLDDASLRAFGRAPLRDTGVADGRETLLVDWCRHALPESWHGAGIFELMGIEASCGRAGVTLPNAMSYTVFDSWGVDAIVERLARFTCPATRLFQDELAAWRALDVRQIDLVDLCANLGNRLPTRNVGILVVTLPRSALAAEENRGERV